MAKKIVLEEGMLFSIELDDNAWTLAQLCFLFKGVGYEQYTLAFFNHLYSSEEELKNDLSKLDLSEPIIITTINGHPIKNYGLNLIGKREINYSNVPNYRTEIDDIGLYQRSSSDFDHLLVAYFGLYPWDGYYIDTYVDEALTPGTSKRDDVKYMKDYTIEELKKIMTPDSIKLIELLEKQ